MIEQSQPTTGAFLPVQPIELFDEVEVWDDDMFAAAHEGAANDLLDEYTRTEAEQKARDDIASRALELIASAAESPFSNAGRRLELVSQLVSRLGALCDSGHLHDVLDKNLPGNNILKKHAKTAAEVADTDDDERTDQAAEIGSWLSRVAKGLGVISMKPLLAGLRMLLPSHRDRRQNRSLEHSDRVLDRIRSKSV